MKRLLPLVLFLTACTASVQPPAPPSTPSSVTSSRAASPVHVVIVSTTDLHGWYGGHQEGANHTGGLALFASYVSALREANGGRVVLVDSGDLFQGTLDSNFFEGEPIVKAYSHIGYAAAAVGNHEFDFGPVGPDAMPRNPADDPLGALKRNASMATFPFLSANLTEKATGRTPPWARRYLVVSSGGARIGIIGLSTPDTPNVTMPENVRSLAFGDPIPATVAAAKELRAQGADAIVVIGHMGGRCRNVDGDPADTSSCEQEQEAMRFLLALPAGTIDAYFGGHTHARMRQIVAGISAFQPAPFNEEFSTLDLTIDPAAHRVISSTLRPLTSICATVYSGTQQCDAKRAPAGSTLVPRMFEGKAIVADAGVAAILQPYIERVAAKRNEPLGIHSNGIFTRFYSRESTLGDLLTDAMRSSMGTDIAVINSGGIRANLRTGDLVYSDLFDVSPFDNYPVAVTMSGRQIAEMLRLTGNGERGIMQVSGLKYTIDAAKGMDLPATQRDRIVSITLADGRAIDPKATYTVGMPDFLVAGGEGLSDLMKSVPPERIRFVGARPLRELLIESLQKQNRAIAPGPLDRITILNAPPSADR